MIDTHCHFYLKEFDADRLEILQKGMAEGVEKFLLPAIDSSHTASIGRLAHDFPDICFSMAGLHPCSVRENFREELLHVESLLSERSFVAIGETGLDFYWDKTFFREQYASLEHQIHLCLRYDLPIVLHTRNATRETIDFVAPYTDKGLRGVFHCFGGSLQEAKDITEMGFYLGIGGVVTYKNAGLDKVLAEITLDQVLLETDAPYLSPVPFRGKRNEAVYLKVIAQKIADIKGISFEEVDDLTSRNARRLFRL